MLQLIFYQLLFSVSFPQKYPQFMSGSLISSKAFIIRQFSCGARQKYTPSVPKKKSFWDSKFIPKNKSSYPIQKVHMHGRINQCQIWKVNRGKYGHFIFLLICSRISRMTYFLGRRERYITKQLFLTTTSKLNIHQTPTVVATRKCITLEQRKSC